MGAQQILALHEASYSMLSGHLTLKALVLHLLGQSDCTVWRVHVNALQQVDATKPAPKTGKTLGPAQLHKGWPLGLVFNYLLV